MAHPALEKHYSPAEVADLWGLSTQTVIEMFRDEPGVVAISMRRVQSRRAPRTTLRIPESVLTRLHEQWARGFDAKGKRFQRSVKQPLVRSNPRRVVALSGTD